jgi:transcriptional regulator with XRE-family HTH domain
MKKIKVEVPNLADVSFSQALTIARALSGMTNEEIAERMGKGKETIRRYFTDPTYNPPTYLLPKLCNVLGNFILVEWLAAHAGGCYVPNLHDCDLRSIDTLVAELTKEFSDVLKEDSIARLNDTYEPDELSRMEKELTEMMVKGEQTLRLIRKEKEGKDVQV